MCDLRCKPDLGECLARIDVEFQVRTFVESLRAAPLLGETFPVFWPNLSAVVSNLFLGQQAVFDDVTAWMHPCIDDLEHLPDLSVRWENRYFKAIEDLMKRLGMADFYAARHGLRVHWPPVLAWILSLLICLGLWYLLGIQEFFLCLPGWLLSGGIYLVASKLMQKTKAGMEGGSR